MTTTVYEQGIHDTLKTGAWIAKGILETFRRMSEIRHIMYSEFQTYDRLLLDVLRV